MYKKIKLLLISGLFATSIAQAQTENSPYSRYGLGDQLPSENILSRGIGGVGAAYSDILTVNFLNPASYSRLKRATFDFGVELDSRTLKTINPPTKFSSFSPIISYVQLGIPLSQKRNWGMNIGLRPITRVNYSIQRNDRLPGIDSINTLFEGSGGSYEVYTGTGFAFKGLSLGFNIGYLFGTKDYKSSRSFIPDSTNVFYYPGRVVNATSFGGLFGSGGLQYQIRLTKKNLVRLGAYGTIKRDLNATSDISSETFSTGTNGTDTIDVASKTHNSGKITYPSSFGVGAMYYAGERWLIGADFSKTNWSEYRYFGQLDSVQDSWKFHVGGQIIPNYTNAKSYWSRVTYRAGFNYGKDNVRLNDKDLPTWGLSFGLGLPMRPPSYSNQYSIINTSVEFGQRGNNTNVIKENFFRLSIGLTLSDLWFIKRKYD